MDCVLTVNYISEKTRMTKDCDINCARCPLGVQRNGVGCECNTFEKRYPAKAVEIVQRWSDEHQSITYGEDFEKQLPLAYGRRFRECIKYYYGDESIADLKCDDSMICAECWDRPIPQDILNKLKEARKNGLSDN